MYYLTHNIESHIFHLINNVSFYIYIEIVIPINNKFEL